MEHYDITAMNRFGSLRDEDAYYYDECAYCGEEIYENDGLTYVTDKYENIFCGMDCAVRYYGLNEQG